MAALPNPNPTFDRDDASKQALMRLQASRQKLQYFWLPATAPKAPAKPARSWRLWWRQARRQFQHVPVVATLADALWRWWSVNPWREAGEMVAAEFREQLSPWVRRHPVGAVTVAVTAGVVVAAVRPWRWPMVAGQLRSLPPRLGHWIARVATKSVLPNLPAILAALAATGAAATAASAAATAAAASSPEPATPGGTPNPAVERELKPDSDG